MIHLRELTVQGFKQLREVELAFPRRGRVLVQGLNEAGKSTLFEAIFVALFGQALDGRSLDECIQYDADEAWVRLVVSLADGRRLAIGRRLRRGRPNVWTLDVVAADGAVEEVRGNSVVNARVAAELALDAEALLNTCFVEQKKLAKLEGMNRRQREESLMKLLNLDRLLALGAELRVTARDQADAARLRRRAELADLQAELPALEAAAAEAEVRLARAEARDALAHAAAERAALDELGRALDEARAAERALAERAAAADRMRSARAALAAAAADRERARAAGDDIARLEVEAAAARRARDEDVPAVLARGLALKRLRGRLGWLGAVERGREACAEAHRLAEADLARLADLREALNATRRSLVAARAAERDAATDAEALAQDLRAFDVREALAAHGAARAGRAALGDAAPDAERLQGERAWVARAFARQAAILGTLAAALAAAAILGPGPAWAWAWVPAAALVLVLGARAFGAARRLAALDRAIARREGEALARTERIALLEEQAGAALERLRALNAMVPATPERAAEALAELEARLADRTRQDVDEALQEARAARARGAAEAAALEAREAELRAAAGPDDAASAAVRRDEAAAGLARRERSAARRRPALAAQAAELGTALEAPALDELLGALRGELERARAEAGRLPGLEQALADRRAARTEALAAAAAGARVAAAALPEADTSSEPGVGAGLEPARPAGPRTSAWPPAAAPAPVPGSDADHANARMPVADALEGEPAWRDLEARLEAAFEAAGGEAVRAEHRQAADAASRLAGQHAQAERALASLLARARGLVATLPDGPALPEGPSEATLSAARAALIARLPGDPPAERLRAARDEAATRREVSRRQQGALALELGLAGEVLDAAACARARDEAERALAVRERAERIATTAGRNVVRRVMPSTIAYMRRLLPLLTGGRYFDAQLSDDYKIEVFDERAGRWLRKNLFSGGTQDQMSLALRLAFALATLPEERGAAPSFLFLDEPLGAFDTERARALLHLLSEGEIAESFDQIFLISHVRVAGEAFDHHLVLEEGRVAESDLPAAS